MMIRSRLLFVFCGVLGAAATKLTVCVLDIVNLPHTDGGFWAPDPYVHVTLLTPSSPSMIPTYPGLWHPGKDFSTLAHETDANPVWNTCHYFDDQELGIDVVFTVWDFDPTSLDDNYGRSTLHLDSVGNRPHEFTLKAGETLHTYVYYENEALPPCSLSSLSLHGTGMCGSMGEQWGQLVVSGDNLQQYDHSITLPLGCPQVRVEVESGLGSMAVVTPVAPASDAATQLSFLADTPPGLTPVLVRVLPSPSAPCAAASYSVILERKDDALPYLALLQVTTNSKGTSPVVVPLTPGFSPGITNYTCQLDSAASLPKLQVLAVPAIFGTPVNSTRDGQWLWVTVGAHGDSSSAPAIVYRVEVLVAAATLGNTILWWFFILTLLGCVGMTCKRKCGQFGEATLGITATKGGTNSRIQRQRRARSSSQHFDSTSHTWVSPAIRHAPDLDSHHSPENHSHISKAPSTAPFSQFEMQPVTGSQPNSPTAGPSALLESGYEMPYELDRELCVEERERINQLPSEKQGEARLQLKERMRRWEGQPHAPRDTKQEDEML